PHHEALADLYRIAIGGAGAGLVVDARRDERRAAVLERRREQPLEVVLVRRPGTLHQAAAARHRDNVGDAGARRRLAAGDLVHAVVPDDHRQVIWLAHRHGGEAAELHQQRAVALERDDVALRLRDGDAERDRNRQAHAAEHIEVLRSLAAHPEIEISIADAADDGFLVLQVRDGALGQLEAVHHLGVVRAVRGRRCHGGPHAANTLPPVRSGDRMKVTGACVAMACLIERSTMKASSSWRVMVCVSMPSASSTGRIVRQTIAWPRLNSPSVPRSETKISAGICDGHTSEATAFGMVAKPDVCISTAARRPPIQAPVTMPIASSSRVQGNVVKKSSACSASISGVKTRSGTYGTNLTSFFFRVSSTTRCQGAVCACVSVIDVAAASLARQNPRDHSIATPAVRRRADGSLGGGGLFAKFILGIQG